MMTLLRRAPVFFLLLILPLGASAATFESLLPAKSAAQVTRAQFMEAASTALKVSSQEIDRPTRTITRGDAVKVLAELLKEKKPQVIASPNRPLVSRDAKKLIAQAVKRAAPVTSTSGITIGYRKIGTTTAMQEDLAILKTVWNWMKSEYVYPEKVDPENKGFAVWQTVFEQRVTDEKMESKEALYKTADEMMAVVGDPYTIFMRPVRAKAFKQQLKGEVVGIGAQVELIDGVLTIVSPLKNSPAEKAGLKPGDQILLVNDEVMAGLNLADGVDKVRGEAGSVVTLHIRRNTQEMDVTLTRAIVKVPDIEVTWKGNIPVVQIMQFGENTEKDLRGIITDIMAKNPVGIVLDLRNNPGGYIESADTVLGVFLPNESKVATIVLNGGERDEFTKEDPIVPKNLPVVVLVNEGSASASEIVAGALQDTKRATIVGKITFGKGTVQIIGDLSDGSSAKITIAEWLTPKRRKINRLGILPDIVVESSEQGDEQLQRALLLLH